MNIALRRTITLAAVAVLALSAFGLSGCKKTPQLTPQQLAAGVIPAEHPVDQQTATEKGCNCHTAQ